MVPRPDWHAYKPPPQASPEVAPSAATIKSSHDHAKSLLDTGNAVNSATHLTKSSERQFLSTIMVSGTLLDKTLALTLISQESPYHTMKSLEILPCLASKRTRSQAGSSMAAIKDLFGPASVLPENRKLRFFSNQPERVARKATANHLIIWAHKDWLKNFCFEVLTTLQGHCTDPGLFHRINAIGFIDSLLNSNPECEANQLRLLVGKLVSHQTVIQETHRLISRNWVILPKGLASKVPYLLLQLQMTHPAMKTIIVSAIESEVLLCPGNGLRVLRRNHP